MQKLVQLSGTAIPLDYEDIDTDQILPAKYLVLTSKDGYGKYLFYNRKFNENEELIADFPLNQNKYNTAKIMIVGPGFGSGSSREHAVWAILQAGFKAIIGSSFHDIFYNNACNNGLLLIKTHKNNVEFLMEEIKKNPQLKIDINLEEQVVNTTNLSFDFAISQFSKEKILHGFDNVSYLLSKRDKIQEYERTHLI